MEKEPVKIIFSEEKLRTLILRKLRSIFIPSAVYRIQLNRDFMFKDAEIILPYLKELGVEAVYCSPYFQASPGSVHGYNVTDPNLINPEIGSPEEYEQFCGALAKNGLGQIVDVVPNHMGVSGNNNSWWLDVLENGPSSLYARYFDIDWKPVKQELEGKVLLPVLGDLYGRVLENQEIRLSFEKGEFSIVYHDHRFPIDPKTYPEILEHAIGDLEKELTGEHPDYLEYLSVITAFKNLPSATDCSAEKMTERNREKDIAKQRLNSLVSRSPAVRKFVDSLLVFFNGVKADPRSFDPMDQLLNYQHYRLALWSVASQEINYRRFFDINELAAIRVEDEEVFRHYHQLLFDLIRQGKVHGLRIDHPDGLYDPPAYFRRLQREYLLQMALKESEERARAEGREAEAVDVDAVRLALDTLLINEFSSKTVIYVVAEKILDRKEPLPEICDIHGTVGYDYLNVLNGIFVDDRNENKFAKLYESYIGHRIDFEELVYNKKKFFGLVHMAGEINALGHRLDRISEMNRCFRDFTRNDLTLAIREVIACFPVYRTYVSPDSTSVSKRDEKYIRIAVDRAKQKTPALNPAVYDFLREALLLNLKTEPGGEESRLYRDFLLRFQQLTGPIMAKGLEDTAFYVYNRLLSLNEVGGAPFYFGHTSENFHQHNITRNKHWPYSMITSSTHDTKRSEDVRMRINVLSEMPEEWKVKIDEWGKLNRKLKTAIDDVAEPRANTEYFIYQTLIGAWPDEAMSAAAMRQFSERIGQCALKSVREAKIYTSWSRPNTEYEKVVYRFIRSILNNETAAGFLKSFRSFQKRVSFLGKLNSLSATVLKIASPGVVDIYQGNETWSYGLVDPDNRRPVDFNLRKHLLADVERKHPNVAANTAGARDSGLFDMNSLKLLYTWKMLRFRREHKELFLGADYIPVAVKGKGARNVVAFIRKRGDKIALAVAGRFFADCPFDKRSNVASDFWSGTELSWPIDAAPASKLRDVIAPRMVDIVTRKDTATVKVSELFLHAPVCLLTNIKD
ncbi:MAG: malto-oligosyltrehalose synthase [Candidatus Omnitrophica bacterium]|nr:malto-oligosyltrehalose synthase [Candidatus Omnitrophota bacterium]